MRSYNNYRWFIKKGTNTGYKITTKEGSQVCDDVFFLEDARRIVQTNNNNLMLRNRKQYNETS